MKSIRTVVAGLVMAAGVTAALPLTAGTAAAADSVACNAPKGQYCVAFDMNKKAIYQSARVNGQCQTGPFRKGGRTHFPSTFVDVTRSASIEFYVQNGNCGAGEGILGVTIYPASSNAGYRWGIDGRWAIVKY